MYVSALELTFEQGNAEFSCAAESPRRNGPCDDVPSIHKTLQASTATRCYESLPLRPIRDHPPWSVLCVQNSSSQESVIAKQRGIFTEGQGFFAQDISSRTSSHYHRRCFRTTKGVVNRGTFSSRQGPHNTELSCAQFAITSEQSIDPRSDPIHLAVSRQLQRVVMQPAYSR